MVGEYVACDAQGRPDLTSLAGALGLLAELAYLQAPADYALRVSQAVKAVAAACGAAAASQGAAATGGGGGGGGGGVAGGGGGGGAAAAEREVSADVLVAVMVLVVVHAELPHGYSLLQHTKQYLDAGTSRSELGYCMCTFELSVEYVKCCDDV